MKPIPDALAFTPGRAVGMQSFNHIYGGWDGHAKLSWPGSKLVTAIACDPCFSHLVIFTAPDSSLTLEPVTHVTDGFNSLAKDVDETGVVALEPQEISARTAPPTVRE